MRIAQRGTSAVTSSVSSQYPVDRWICLNNSSNTITFQQSTVVPAGFINSIKATVTSGGSSYSASQYTFLYQKIEGFNTADLAYGSSSAKTVTVSFWVQSSVTGTYTSVLENSTGTQNYIAPFTINVANTWEYKTIQIPGSTSGTWLTDNGIGLSFYIVLGSGTSYENTPNVWTSGKYSVSGSVDLGATNGATFYLTGVQLEVNTQQTPFEQRPIGVELQLCQRYYVDPVTYLGQAAGIGYGGASAYWFIAYWQTPVPMRINPNVSGFSTSTLQYTNTAGNGAAVTSVLTSGSITPMRFYVIYGVSGYTTGQVMNLSFSGAANSVSVSAEL